MISSAILPDDANLKYFAIKSKLDSTLEVEPGVKIEFDLYRLKKKAV